MSEIHRRRPQQYKFEFSFVGDDRRSLQKSGMCQENRNAPNSPDSSPLIPDNRGYLRFGVFISWQNLGWLGSSKIPDHLGFSQHFNVMPRSLKSVTFSIEFPFKLTSTEREATHGLGFLSVYEHLILCSPFS